MLPVSTTLTVQGLISALLKTVGNKFFRELLVDVGTEDPRPKVIILLNDQDCNIFDGLKTQIEPGTRVTIIPVAHGGSTSTISHFSRLMTSSARSTFTLWL